MQCPVCDNVDLAISSREGVEIDFCPQCRGVWLDRGELDKVVDRAGMLLDPAVGGARAARDEPRRPEPDYYDDRDRGHDPRRRRRRSFLDDIFEFD